MTPPWLPGYGGVASTMPAAVWQSMASTARRPPGRPGRRAAGRCRAGRPPPSTALIATPAGSQTSATGGLVSWIAGRGTTNMPDLGDVGSRRLGGRALRQRPGDHAIAAARRCSASAVATMRSTSAQAMAARAFWCLPASAAGRSTDRADADATIALRGGGGVRSRRPIRAISSTLAVDQARLGRARRRRCAASADMSAQPMVIAAAMPTAATISAVYTLRTSADGAVIPAAQVIIYARRRSRCNQRWTLPIPLGCAGRCAFHAQGEMRHRLRPIGPSLPVWYEFEHRLRHPPCDLSSRVFTREVFQMILLRLRL